MNTASHNLERSFQSFIGNEKPMPFFKGLAEYLEYVFATPKLKEVFREQMDERNQLYIKVAELEGQSQRELNDAKIKLLKLIKKLKVDVKNFQRFNTWSVRPEMDMLQELEAYENGGIRGAGFLSEEIGKYLFDISANLLILGFRKDVEEFLVSSEEYSAYYQRVNAPSSSIIVRNEQGDFIFSKTLPERHENAELIKRGRILRPWGSFEMLYRFKQAYKNSTANKDPAYNFQRPDAGEFGVGPETSPDDIVGITFIQGDFDNLVKHSFPRFAQNTPSTERRRYLILEDFRSATKVVHSRLMRVVDSGEIEKDNKASFYITKEGDDFYYKGQYINISKNTDYYKVFAALYAKVHEGGEVSYKELIAEIKSRLPKTKGKTDDEMQKFIQRNLTDRGSGFMRYAGIPKTEDNGKPLIKIIRNSAVMFNNKAG